MALGWLGVASVALGSNTLSQEGGFRLIMRIAADCLAPLAPHRSLWPVYSYRSVAPLTSRLARASPEQQTNGMPGGALEELVNHQFGPASGRLCRAIRPSV